MEQKNNSAKDKKTQQPVVVERIKGFVAPKAIGTFFVSIIAEIIFLIPVFVCGLETFSSQSATIMYAVAVGILSLGCGRFISTPPDDDHVPKQRCKASTFKKQLEGPSNVFFFICIACVVLLVLGCTKWEMSEKIKVVLFFVACGSVFNIMYWIRIVEDFEKRSCPVCDEMYAMVVVDVKKDERRKAIYEDVPSETKTLEGRTDSGESVTVQYRESGYRVRTGTKVKATLYKTYKCKACGHEVKKTEFETRYEDN